MSNKKLLHVKNDAVFRMFFADERNQDLLVSFLKSVLKLPDEDYNEIEILDPNLLPEFHERIVFYDAKLITEQLGTGDDYIKINQVISIVITNEQLIESPRYHHRFTLYDSDARIEFSDIIEIHTLELSKLP